jgi:hypothetical protein
MINLSSEVQSKIIEISSDLEINPDDLTRLINFESKFNPQAKNPYSSARGLIQFIDSTAQDLGFADSLDLVTQHPTVIDQLQIVYEYLSRFYPFKNQQDLYMSVFYPKYRKVDPQTVFPDSIQSVNPGIITVQDYVDFVNRRGGL